MRKSQRFYPASPKEVPEDFLRSTGRYRMQVAVVLATLVVFLVFYAACVAASGWLLFEAATYPIGRIGVVTILIKVGACFMTGMLFVFLVKGLFKIQRDDRSGLVEVHEDQEPRLFAFLRALTEETGAPMPKHVYLSAEVNAAVFYDHSVLSLILPVQKNLLIGCGLVNHLNVSELKAVLGHELGHFSQSSMRLGSYVYLANRVVADLVYARDKWDDLLDGWRRQDLRIAVFGWILTGIVWLVRQVLQGMFKAMNFLHAGLMRQMELDADRMAVAVAGSDAIVHSLVRSRFADLCLRQTFTDLTHAGDHGLFTRDIFHHQTTAAEYLRRFHKKPEWGIPRGLGPAERVFDPDDPSEPPPSMWASHPPDADRESNAKAVYLACPIDERSAWELFSDPSAVRLMVTHTLMRRLEGGRPIELCAPDKVQAFIDEERSETTFDPRYHDMYEGRSIDPGDIDDAFATVSADREGPLRALEDIWSDSLASTMAHHRALGEEAQQIAMALDAAGGGMSGAVQLRGQRLTKAQANARLDELDDELKQVMGHLASLDEQVLCAHVALAKHVDTTARTDYWTRELHARYAFHVGIQKLSDDVRVARVTIQRGLSMLDGKGSRLEQGEFQQLLSALDTGHRVFSETLARSRDLVFPELSNMPSGRPLRDFLLVGPPVASNAGYDRIDGTWIQQLLAQIGEVQDKLQRLFFKSMGGLLRFQEEIVAAAREGDSPADATPSELG
ncbi:MAG: M48 family metallopeptidase [Sandaracinaceae bacterium]